MIPLVYFVTVCGKYNAIGSSYVCSAGASGDWGVACGGGDDAVNISLGYKKIFLYDMVYAADNEMHARMEKPE